MPALAFRSRLFGILLLFAIVPALLLTLVGGVLANKAIPLLGGSAAWERLGESGKELVRSMDGTALTPQQRTLLETHARELEESITQARRVRFLSERVAPALLLGGVITLVLLGFASSRVAGHLSRQLSRPVHELVHWTGRIARGEPLPDTPPVRGAPEFAVLRSHMRDMAAELEQSRARAMEAERLRAYRESAQRVAHELKNPLTPIRFALARVEREAPAELREPLEVIRVETERLEHLARDFAQFGRLPSGPATEIDVEELVRYTARATVPPAVTLDIAIEPGVPRLTGHYDALQRALSNVLLNAVDACGGAADARIGVHVACQRRNGHDAVDITVRDSGAGIPPDRLASIWEPYVTTKRGGTGLGLAIARQAVEAHGGDVAAESAPGSGTAIRFSIPIRSQRPEAGGRTLEEV